MTIPGPVPDGDNGYVSPGHPKFDPIWARIAEAGVPFAFHAGLSGVGHYGKLWRTSSGGDGGGGFSAFQHAVFPMVAFQDRGISDTFAALICHGVLERFPALRLASIENGAMWVPDLLRNLKDGSGKMPFAFKQHPVDQFTEHVWVAPYYEDDMALLKDAVGVENLLFGSDFPHTEGLPEPTQFVKDIPSFTPEETKAIMRDNVLELPPRRLSHLPAPVGRVDGRPEPGGFADPSGGTCGGEAIAEGRSRPEQETAQVSGMLSPMTHVGVVGLGNIGGAIAANLAADGHQVRVTDLDRARAESIVGATAVATIGDVAQGSEITFTSLPTPEVVEAVAAEWAASAEQGAILVDLSTTLPAANQKIAARLAAGGHHFVEAPLTGGAIGAQGRSLVFMVGGEKKAVDRVAPLLDQLGRATFRMGPVGTGTTMKLVNSLLAFACTWASLEALSMAVSAGVDVRTAVEVVRTGGASNFFIDRAVEGINQRNKPVQFALGLAAKDAGLIQQVATDAGVSASIAAAMVEVLSDAVARGLGDHDWGDLVLAAEARGGVELTIAPKAEG